MSEDPYRPPEHAEPGREQAPTDAFLRRVWVLMALFVGMSFLLPVGLVLQGQRLRLFSVDMVLPYMAALVALYVAVGRLVAWRTSIEEAPVEAHGALRVRRPRGWTWEGEDGVSCGVLRGPGVVLQLAHEGPAGPSEPLAPRFQELAEERTLHDRRPRSLRVAGAELSGESVTYLDGWIPVAVVAAGADDARGRLVVELTYEPMTVPWSLIERLLAEVWLEPDA